MRARLRYVNFYRPDHPNADRNGIIRGHVLAASVAMGKPLPLKAVVHHVNEDTTDNSPSNLVVCQDAAYHKLLHVRLNALRACGNPSWRKCAYCHSYSPVSELYRSGTTWRHRACHTDYSRARWPLRKLQRMDDTRRIAAKEGLSL